MTRTARLPRLHSRLLVLAGVTLVPVLVLSIVLAGVLVQRQNDALRDAAVARNRTLVSAVDAQLAGHLATLRVLASSRALEGGDLRVFQELSERATQRQPDWRNVILVDAQGVQRTNASFPWGVALPHERPEALADLRALLAEEPGAARIRQLGHGPSGYVGVPVQQSVIVAGEPMVLEVIVKPEALARLMSEQHLPATWTLALADAQRLFIARVPDRPVGEPVSASLREAMARAPHGWYRGRTLEGRDTFTAYVRSPLTGWTVACAIPAEEVLAPARTALWIIGAGVILSVVVALGFATWLARRIGRPIARLADDANLLAAGMATSRPAGAADASVEEVRQLALALDTAAAAVSERETLMKREQGALMAADKAKDEFLAMLGHELRNPLSAITASAHVLRLSAPDAAPAAMARQVIERQARQMTRLVEDLFDISRLAMHKVTLQPEPLDLGTVVERAVQSWQQAMRRREGRVALRVDPVWVEGDRARLEQVIANLLDNAEKFSHERGPIEVTVRADGKDALLEVTDHGQGIAPEHLARIFDPFVQGPQPVDRPHGGLGLGLALVQRLASLHGGRVEVESAGVDQGATFRVRLARREPPAAETPARTGAAGAGTNADVNAACWRILLVEDNEDGRRVMETLLTMEGHAVRSAPDGATALAIAADAAPDVILVDIGLPDIDGHELARRLRAMPWTRRPRLVALSGYGQPDDQRRAYEAGFDLHLTKPVAPEFLREVFGALTARGAVKG